jgi:uncharacterized protein YecT (DUF1311 family)
MRNLSPSTIGLLVLSGLLLIGLVFLFTRGGDAGEDRLSNGQATANVAVEDPEAKCAEAGNFDRIKRELFKRAAATRPDDAAAFEKLAGSAVLRAETPILRGYNQQADNASCSAYVTLDLPPGVAIPGGGRSLSAEIGYIIQAGTLTLADVEAIVGPLATLTTEGAAPEDGLEQAPTGDELAALPESAAKPVGAATGYPGRPSFNCDDAATRGEIAVCNDAGLSALDVNMAGQYRRAVASASPDQKAILSQTRDRFLAYRDSCQTVGCMREAYTGRMREIRDIMEGRWQPR